MIESIKEVSGRRLRRCGKIVAAVLLITVSVLVLSWAHRSYRVTMAVADLRGTCRTNLDWLWKKTGVDHVRCGGIQEIDFTNTSGDRPFLQDEDLMFLQDVPSLEVLKLAFCEDITDKSLVHLKSLYNLKTLDLRGTQVTLVGVKELKRSLPDCHIQHDFSTN